MEGMIIRLPKRNKNYKTQYYKLQVGTNSTQDFDWTPYNVKPSKQSIVPEERELKFKTLSQSYPLTI
jgi:hypothetical protein